MTSSRFARKLFRPSASWSLLLGLSTSITVTTLRLPKSRTSTRRSRMGSLGRMMTGFVIATPPAGEAPRAAFDAERRSIRRSGIRWKSRSESSPAVMYTRSSMRTTYFGRMLLFKSS